MYIFFSMENNVTQLNGDKTGFDLLKIDESTFYGNWCVLLSCNTPL